MRWAIALIRQWFHCLTHTMGKHRQSFMHCNHKMTAIECECGKVFWELDGYKEWNAYMRGYLSSKG